MLQSRDPVGIGPRVQSIQRRARKIHLAPRALQPAEQHEHASQFQPCLSGLERRATALVKVDRILEAGRLAPSAPSTLPENVSTSRRGPQPIVKAAAVTTAMAMPEPHR